jgi:hypothetical protein
MTLKTLVYFKLNQNLVKIFLFLNKMQVLFNIKPNLNFLHFIYCNLYKKASHDFRKLVVGILYTTQILFCQDVWGTNSILLVFFDSCQLFELFLVLQTVRLLNRSGTIDVGFFFFPCSLEKNSGTKQMHCTTICRSD